MRVWGRVYYIYIHTYISGRTRTSPLRSPKLAPAKSYTVMSLCLLESSCGGGDRGLVVGFNQHYSGRGWWVVGWLVDLISLNIATGPRVVGGWLD